MSRINDDYWYYLPNVSYAPAQHTLEVRVKTNESLFVKLGKAQEAQIRKFLEQYEPFPWGAE